MKKALIWGLMLIFLISVFSGVGKVTQTTEGEVVVKLTKTYNSHNPDSFDWAKGNYATIGAEAWKTLDLNNIPKERVNDIPVGVIESRFSALSSAQKKSLSAEKLAQGKILEKSKDLIKDFGKKNAQDAIEKKYSRRVSSFGKGALIKNDVLHATSGVKGHVTLSHPGYNGYSFAIDDKGNIDIFPLNDVKDIDVPKGDKIIINAVDNQLNYKGNKIKGRLYFDQGKTYIVSKMEVEINGIHMTSWKRRTDIYFDGKEHSGNYVSFGFDEGRIITEGSMDGKVSWFRLRIRPGNKFFPMEKKDYLSFVNCDGKILVQARPKLVSEVTYGPNSKGELRIATFNGKNQVEAEKDHVQFKIYSEQETSVPMVLHVLDKDGNSIVGSKNEKERIIFDNDNALAIVPKSISPERLECVGCSLKPLNDNRVFVNYIAARARKVGITSYSGDLVKMSILVEAFKRLPAKLKKEVKHINIVKSKKEWICSSTAIGCATYANQNIYLHENFDLSIVYHEAAHTYHYAIMKKEKKMLIKFKKEMKKLLFKKGGGSLLVDVSKNKVQLKEPNGRIIYLAPEEKEKLLKLAKANKITHYKKSKGPGRPRVTQETFNSKIRKIVGDSLGKNLAFREKGLPVEWVDKKPPASRFGCTRAYGCNNEYEYVATFIENIAKGQHSEYQELINPKGWVYLGKMGKPIFEGSKIIMTPQLAKKWAKKYREGLELLKEEGLIELKDYKKIMAG